MKWLPGKILLELKALLKIRATALLMAKIRLAIPSHLITLRQKSQNQISRMLLTILITTINSHFQDGGLNQNTIIKVQFFPHQVNNNFIYNQCCPSQLPSPNPIPQDLKIMVSQIGATLDSLINLLNNLVDGGKTDEMNSTIFTSTPPDALDVKLDLLNSSPYLSDTVMKSAIDKESVLPNEMIRDVLVANPQSAKTEDVLNTLNNRFVPMPDSMMAEIMDGKDQLSPKEVLEAHIAMYAQYFMDAYNSLVLYYLTDSISSASPDSIINFLESTSDLDGKYLLASEYLAKGDTSDMDHTLSSIASIFTLDRIRYQQCQDYLTYFAFLKSLKAQNKDILQVDSSQIAQLLTLYNQSSEPVVSFVRNILIANNVFNYFEPIIIPDDSTKSTLEKNFLRTSHFAQECYLKLFPTCQTLY